MQTSTSTFLQVSSGKLVSLVEPHPNQIDWRDIGEQLSKTNRFNGATRSVAYSVAQHSCLVADHCAPENRLAALLHDAHEYVLGDWTTPFKNAVKRVSPEAFFAMDRIETQMSVCIMNKAGLRLPLNLQTKEQIKEQDMRALATERRDLMIGCAPHLDAYWGGLPEPWPKRIKPWAWPKASEEWLSRFHDYIENPAYAEALI